MEDYWWTSNATYTFEVSDSVVRFKKDISFANHEPFCMIKALATSEFDNEMTCKQQPLHYQHLSLEHWYSTYPINVGLIGYVASILSL